MSNASGARQDAAATEFAHSPAAWTVREIEADRSWIYRLSDAASEELIGAVRRAAAPDKPLLAYRRCDFSFPQAMPVLSSAFNEVRDGRGMALVRGLPREGVSMDEFRLMTWAIGLHFGVARPQNRLSAYIERVANQGGQYRSPTGRGYSSNAELDFHVDGSDVVLLSCYNQAVRGGMSMCTSGVTAYWVMKAERPDLAEVLHTPYPFSRNGEEREGEAPWFMAPLVGVEKGRLFCAWNRNRLKNALDIPGVPRITDIQQEAVDYLDSVLRRPDLMYQMHLEPGDLQLLSNFTMLHSRTSFEDHQDEERRRTLFRLWLSTPDSLPLPAGWEHYYGTREPGVVRGALIGHQYDEMCRQFDRDQGAEMGMKIPEF